VSWRSVNIAIAFICAIISCLLLYGAFLVMMETNIMVELVK